MFNFLREFLFRPKTLNYIIWVLIGFIITQLKAISSTQDLEVLLTELNVDFPKGKYLFILLRLIFLEGSYFFLFFLFILLILICFLKYKEINSFKTPLLDLDSKEEIIARVILNLHSVKTIPKEDYLNAMEIINNNELKKYLKEYYKFHRKRGNVYELEKFLLDTDLIIKLKNLKY